jgi:hypothetical protein
MKVVTDRNNIEKIVEQELSSILLQSLKLAEKERRPAAKAAMQINLRVIDARREGREKARLNELRG